MKFHALLVVRDEADIIAQSLHHLLTWADAVYVLDTGSSDETWDLVREYAVRHPAVRPLRHMPVFFSDKLPRAWLFHQARQHMREGDWFLRVDADEFHHLHPAEFVRDRLRHCETVVYHQYYDFRLTDSEVSAWEQGKESLKDRARSIADRRRWFTVSAYSEPRLCRYRESMRWPETASFPYHAGFIAVERFPIRHYPHRDPVQLARRCRLRAAMVDEPDNAEVRHWKLADWRQHVVSQRCADLQFWQPGADLPEPRLTNHLGPMAKRVVQRCAHACCLSLLDRLHPGYSPGAFPRPLPRELQARLETELGPNRSSISQKS